jgi:hypothetical protein
MATGEKFTSYRFCAAALLGGALLVGPAPARAGGFIESFFNSLGHVLRAPDRLPAAMPLAEPMDQPERTIGPAQERADAGLAKAFCVRTCDGHFFPVQAHAGMSTVEACRSFCPASQTKLYAGSTIDYAVARDGSRYANLPSAYEYRKHLVAGCTCNGRDQFGLAHIDATGDPTLKAGDVVATTTGLMAFTGRRNGGAEFTPAASYSQFSKSYRDQLAAMGIAPSAAPPAAEAALPTARELNLRSAQR